MKMITCVNFFPGILTKKMPIFLLILLLLSACDVSTHNREKDGDYLHVQTQKAVRKTVPMYIDSFGSLAAYEDVDIKPQVSGQIGSIHFKEGEYVEKGDLLVSIDPEIYQANLDNSVATLKYDNADLKLKQYIVEKNRNIAESGAMPRQDFKKMVTDLEKAKAQIKVDEARVRLDEINLKYCSVRSPINGTIGINKIDIGNIVNASDILCNVKCIDPLFVDFTVPEKHINRLMSAIKDGSIKTLIYVKRLDSNGKFKIEHYAGELKFLNNTADSSTGTISLRAIVTNKTKAFLPGEFADVRIQVGKRKNAVLIPQTAVKYGSGGAYIYIAENGYAKRVDVITGQSVDNYYVLLKGAVKPDDNVIVTGLESIIPGAKIVANNAKDRKKNNA
jgi:membrane fusion protein, multidrug efflux system